MNKVMISKVINKVMINSQRPVALLSHPLRPHRELGDPQKGSPLQGSPCPPPPPPPSSPSQNYSPRSPLNLSSPHLQLLCSSFFPSCKANWSQLIIWKCTNWHWFWAVKGKVWWMEGRSYQWWWPQEPWTQFGGCYSRLSYWNSFQIRICQTNLNWQRHYKFSGLNSTDHDILPLLVWFAFQF